MKVIFKLARTAGLAAAAIAVAATPRTAHADRRAYGQTYEAVTAPRGELDVELWTTYAREGEVDGGPASRGVRQMVELEYGLTDHWDVALYNMLDVTTGDTDSGYAGFKVESRFRPVLSGDWVIDPVFYLEFQERLRGDAKQSLEAKVILAKDLGPINISLNASFEGERLTDDSFNPEVEYALGTSFEFSPAFKLGVEAFGKSEPADGGGVETRLWAGPCVSVAASTHSFMRGFWVTVAGGKGLTDNADPYYGRLIVGLQF